jgi:hypothetical protein
MAFVKVPQMLEDGAAVRIKSRGPTFGMVWLGLDDAQAMGYKLAILPALLFAEVIGLCDRLQGVEAYPPSPGCA